ncbi:hypothetical protein [Paucidesulfovibrio longus]|uniref:hypothetical protein n=1 Tax=Paucidesulfovibrio longus TaxID=889 RepID=UPI0012DD6E34|nr:hypothetical protein [Paucidesulfovibrio longus]
MRRSPKPAKAVRAEATPLPFAGLGHSLTGVSWAAANMTLRPAARSDEGRVFARGMERPRPVSGYGLLVALGRETRGR